MDKEKTLLRLSTEIDTIKAHINRLKKSNYHVHQLDIDMLKKKTMEFYELVFELESPSTVKENVVIEDVKVENGPKVEAKSEIESKVEIKNEVEVKNSQVVKDNPIVEPVPEPEPVVVEKETDKIVPATDSENKVEVIQKESVKEIKDKEPAYAEASADKEEPKKEEQVEAKEEITNEVIDHPAELEKKTEEVKPDVKQTTYDLFSGSADSAIAEKFHMTDEPSIAEKMQKSHIANIREAIGINEKFLFINELFNGDMGRYNKILDDINDLTTKQGVDTYLFELKIQFQWADENEAYLKLKELLDRKFG